MKRSLARPRMSGLGRRMSPCQASGTMSLRACAKAGLGPSARSASVSRPAAKREAAVLLDPLRKDLVAPVTGTVLARREVRCQGFRGKALVKAAALEHEIARPDAPLDRRRRDR